MSKKAVQRTSHFFQTYWKILLAWFIILMLISLGIYFQVDKKIVALIVLVFGLASHAFTGFAVLISTIPVIGPLIIKILSIPIVWLLTLSGYSISAFAIRRGHGKHVANTRILTVIFLVGFTIGFILARIF